MLSKTKKSSAAREQRLARGREWLASYSGNHIIRAYRKQFKLSVEGAARDLLALGAISQTLADGVCRQQQLHAERIREKRKARKALKTLIEEEEEIGSPWDYMFYYVAGYTSGGFPFGIRYEDLSKAEAAELLEAETDPYRRMQLQDRISFLEEHPEGFLPYGQDSRSTASEDRQSIPFDSLSELDLDPDFDLDFDLDLDDDFDELPF